VNDFKLQIPEDCTTEELKRMIQAKTRIPTQDQIISQAGERIEGTCELDVDLSMDVELGECRRLRPLLSDLS
jgi:hypothetical protein